MLSLILPILGGLLNLYRGGAFLPIGTTKQRVLFSIAFGIIAATLYGWGAGVVVAILFFIPWLVGTGRPMGALRGNEKNPLEEFKPVDIAADWVAKSIVNRLNLKASRVRSTYQKVWGVAWFTILWVPVAVLLIPLVGWSSLFCALYGVGAFIGTQFKRDPWKGAEFVGGAMLGMAML